jgi:hypothetical protein
VSTLHHFPWPSLKGVLPQCAEVLAKVRGVSPAFFEESSLKECSGQCAFVPTVPASVADTRVSRA